MKKFPTPICFQGEGEERSVDTLLVLLPLDFLLRQVRSFSYVRLVGWKVASFDNDTFAFFLPKKRWIRLNRQKFNLIVINLIQFSQI